MNLNKIYPGILVGVLILIGVFVFAKIFSINSTSSNSKIQLDQTTLSSNKNGEVAYNCQPGKTAFEALQENHNQVNYQGSSFGRMITGINGVSQGNGKYWQYLVDGKDATVSADAYICQGNEKIIWQLR